jgi:oligoendopeptidase F
MKHMETLNNLWSAYERSGSSLVALRLWRWMYAHPEASPEEIRSATIAISKEVWNSYFAPVIGEKDSTLLSVYSHLISADLFVLQHSMGRIIQFQIETKINDKNLASEMERMCKIGKVTPDIWMKNAVGASVSAEALLKASDEALKAIGE